MTNSERFYAELPAHRMSLSQLVPDASLFHPVPDDWLVIITDIKNSTGAVMDGRHEDVNLIAAGSIVSVLNIAYNSDITLPFFFGGDGATFLIPSILADDIMRSLTRYAGNTRDNFGMELRTGILPVKTIYDRGYEILIAKYSSSKTFLVPIVLGNGLAYAEKVIKAEDHLTDPPVGQAEPDLTGMQCRWDKIPPPIDKEEIVSLLVIARHVTQQPEALGRVLQKLDELYGPPEKRQPISVNKLKLKTTFSRLGTEMRARLGRIKWLELLKTWFITLYGYIWFNTKNGQRYLERLVEMSDTLVIDGKINTVITGSSRQREDLQKLLETMEKEGSILYGLHVSNASVMSCYVRDMEDGHIHFVDGSEGGYTQAARMLKGKLHSGQHV
ncbi:DUF3095 domain-containing protein [Flavobacterium sp.]|uniref:DUF3095 domain-containing protein n=1 Tax=Flavobacterium sp. TaxID=239 RepID=UPI004033ACDD